MKQSVDERALTEDLVVRFDTSSSVSSWNGVGDRLRDLQIYLNTAVKKATREHLVGAEFGITVRRSIYQKDSRSSSTDAILVQCEPMDGEGGIANLFHEVQGSDKRRSAQMLGITPSSFYFIFAPPALVETYCAVEPLAFTRTAPGCSSAIWNMGCFEFNSHAFPYLCSERKAEATGILVVPA